MSALAYFVSSHGFGHAARASAVMSALKRFRPDVQLHIFTSVPRWFFEDSLGTEFHYHSALTDVGLEQSHPFEEDLDATLKSLEGFWGTLSEASAGAAAVLTSQRVDLVASDISPLGLAAARKAGLPGALIENFTWDWIYEAFLDEEPRLEEYVKRSAEVFDGADLRIQATPVCRPLAGAAQVAPVGREARATRDEVRAALGLRGDDSRPFVLLTMGGMGWRATLGEGTTKDDPFLVSLGGVDGIRRSPGRLALPDRAPIYPPDLIAAADLVVAKLGYSTVAECYQTGTRLLFMERPRFAESEVLADFARRELSAESLAGDAFETGAWLEAIREGLTGPIPEPGAGGGATEAASLLAVHLRR